MDWSNWFQLSPAPLNSVVGTYNLYLVFLSYVIAVMASYVALDLVGRLRVENNKIVKYYWLLGGAFAMGAGIWSMHFIGMLAFVLPMPMEYNLGWTIASLLAAILVSALALYLLRDPKPQATLLISGGVLMGIGIATMHYMGMEGMKHHINIHYTPTLFILSIIIAIFAAEGALGLTLISNQGSPQRQFYLKMMSALVMGIAICGMHYTGMAAAVFTPKAEMVMSDTLVPPNLLAFFIAGITALIISLALTVSTYYKRMGNAIQNEKEFLKAILNNLEDGILACNSEGKIIVTNNVIQNADNLELYPVDSDQRLTPEESPLKKALSGERVHNAQYQLKLATGEMRDVVIDGQPIINVDAKKLGAVIVIRDVTEIMKTEKLKREFVSVVSHELRTPLTSIRGSLGLLLGSASEDFPPKSLKLLEIANKNCERLLLLINDILDIEKIEAGQMKFDSQFIDINKLIRDTLRINKMFGEKYGIKFKLHSSVDNVQVFVDPDRLSQVVTNLLSNAAKFSPSGSEVVVSISKNENRVRVSVMDKGPGISPEFRDRIFQKFSQADSSDTRGKGGTGLGLNISKTIMERMAGTLTFDSILGEGTTFYIELPITSQPLAISTEIHDQQPAEPAMNVMVYEDDPSKAQLLSSLLKDSGFQVAIANNATMAQQLLKQNRYQGILLDLVLSDQEGISFIRNLRNNEMTTNLPVIVLSFTSKENNNVLNGDALLVVDWLHKPIDTAQLRSAFSRQHNAYKHLPTILHVEDDTDTQLLVKEILQKQATIIDASNLHEAILKLTQHKIDLVILDLVLPDGKGSELLPIFSKYNLPIIVYSAYELDKEYARYVSQVLTKSKVSNEEFIKNIKKLLQQHIEEDEVEPVD